MFGMRVYVRSDISVYSEHTPSHPIAVLLAGWKGGPMTFEEILQQTVDILQRRGRASYRALQRQFELDDAYLEDLKGELLYAYPQVVDDKGRGLVWTGEPTVMPSAPVTASPLAGH